jgi:pyruvate/2-oxoglutarate dehydrogenase complex dihydrolipoamide acyltransferase (E2) component
VAKALKAAPILNASLVGDEIRVWEDINIGFAVAMMVSEKESGLVVPVIKNADQKGLVEIARVRKDLTDKAREGKLTMDEMTGGTFTITNTGPIAKTWHIQTPIINQPESAILGTSAIVEKPVVKNGEIVISSVMPISFSYDHRIVDGGPVAAFMTKLTELVEDPKMLIL